MNVLAHGYYQTAFHNDLNAAGHDHHISLNLIPTFTFFVGSSEVQINCIILRTYEIKTILGTINENMSAAIVQFHCSLAELQRLNIPAMRKFSPKFSFLISFIVLSCENI
jgi:hypothetical protein